MVKNKKDFITLNDYGKEEIEELINVSYDVKKYPEKYSKSLEGKNFALLFDKHSTRTRLSFECGISQMGGNAIYLSGDTLQIKRGETIEDTAKVLSRYMDGIIIRTFEQEMVESFSESSSIPVINGLTDIYHPCQIISDLFTIKEKGLLKKDLKFTYVGDSNNVSNSLMIGFSKIGIDITIGCPEEYQPEKNIIECTNNNYQTSGGKLNIINDPEEAVNNADIIYTDVWISMGDKEGQEKVEKLSRFKVDSSLVSHAKKEVKIMHCLPAHREMEIDSNILDGENSIVWDQAENRMHAQKSLLLYLLDKEK